MRIQSLINMRTLDIKTTPHQCRLCLMRLGADPSMLTVIGLHWHGPTEPKSKKGPYWGRVDFGSLVSHSDHELIRGQKSETLTGDMVQGQNYPSVSKDGETTRKFPQKAVRGFLSRLTKDQKGLVHVPLFYPLVDSGGL